MRLIIEVGNDGPAAVINAQGEIDIAGVDHLRTAFFRALSDAPSEIRIDCREVTFVDSSGIRVLLQARQDSQRAGIELQILPSARIQRIADALGVSRVLGFDGVR